MSETCKDRVNKALQDRLSDLRTLWQAEQDQPDEYIEDIGTLNEYGLCFDFYDASDDNDERESYFRYQLSTGGPGDEFRFFTGPDYRVHRIEYWFLDWFDSAHIVLEGDDLAFMRELWACVFADGAMSLVATTHDAFMDFHRKRQDEEIAIETAK